jgi:hypothetical protein
MSEGRVDITIMESPGVFIQELRDALTIDVLLDGMLGINVASELVSDHGNLSGLGDDDHLQYFNQVRGDVRYERHLGAPPADDYILSSKANGTRSWIIPPSGGSGTGVEYHNALLGLQGGVTDEYYHFSAALYNAFEYVGGANPYLRIKLPVACDQNMISYADTGWLPPDIWASMPYASATVRGGIQFTGASPATKYLREDGAWEVPAGEGGGEMVYPGVGIARSTGSGWAASLTDNSSGWNEAATWVTTHGANAVSAFGWGNHALAGYLTAITKAMIEAQLTGAITSHSHPAVNTANFSVVEESGKLVIKNGTTVIASFTAAGLVTAADDVVAFGTP